MKANTQILSWALNYIDWLKIWVYYFTLKIQDKMLPYSMPNDTHFTLFYIYLFHKLYTAM